MYVPLDNATAMRVDLSRQIGVSMRYRVTEHLTGASASLVLRASTNRCRPVGWIGCCIGVAVRGVALPQPPACQRASHGIPCCGRRRGSPAVARHDVAYVTWQSGSGAATTYQHPTGQQHVVCDGTAHALSS